MGTIVFKQHFLVEIKVFEQFLVKLVEEEVHGPGDQFVGGLGFIARWMGSRG